MIYGELTDLPRYLGIHKNLDTAIHYILSHPTDFSFLKSEHTVIDEGNVFVNKCSYITAPQDSLSFEAHQYFADIQIILSGMERIAVSSLSDLNEFERNEQNDYIGLKGSAIHNLATMHPGKFLIVFPEDPHMVKIAVSDPAPVNKVVFKVRVASD